MKFGNPNGQEKQREIFDTLGSNQALGVRNKVSTIKKKFRTGGFLHLKPVQSGLEQTKGRVSNRMQDREMVQLKG